MNSHITLVPIWWIYTLFLLSQNIQSSIQLTSSNVTKLDETNSSSSDCNTYTSCTTCVTSSSPCDWCIDGHRCTHDTSENCRNDILVTGVNHGGPSYRSGPSFCPAITETLDGSSDILVHAGTRKSIRVKVRTIAQFIVQTRFLCKYNVEGRLRTLNAQLLAETMYCDSTEFSYNHSAPNVTATLAVIWGGSKPLDNPSNIHVVIYKCNEMAKSENACSSLEKKYECGWCQSSNQCQISNQCNNTVPNKPVDFSNTRIADVNPKQLSRSERKLVSLTMENFPESDTQFVCVFGIQGKDILTNATRLNSTISCATPSTDSLPFLAKGEYNYTAELSVTATNSSISKFGLANVTFFDCNAYSSCTTCVTSPSPCDWCVDGNRCTYDTSENCRYDILVTGVNHGGPSYRSGPAFCPTIIETLGGSSEILIHADTKKSIRFKVRMIGQFIVQTRFLCQYNIEGKVTSLNADLIGDTIYCEQMKFSYTHSAPNVTVPLAVIWGGSKSLDNPLDIHVVIYKCNEMAKSNETCSTLTEKYGCGWCQSTNRCEHSNECAQ
ncbi:plexin-A4-like [Planococcus citri]|uniref:plexin-A4-like n=1 Tax=Planococcus citri TaxID=170843 RepID=UPI0031F8DF4E